MAFENLGELLSRKFEGLKVHFKKDTAHQLTNDVSISKELAIDMVGQFQKWLGIFDKKTSGENPATVLTGLNSYHSTGKMAENKAAPRLSSEQASAMPRDLHTDIEGFLNEHDIATSIAISDNDTNRKLPTYSNQPGGQSLSK